MINTQQLAAMVPNLDGFMTPEDLEAAAAELRPVAIGFNQLMMYCADKAHAMRLRAAGSIEEALAFEKSADGIYNALPDWAKW